MSRIRIWLRDLFRRSEAESDMAEELRFHLESRTNHLIAGGLSPAEAARRARIEFGAIEVHKNDCRESMGVQWVDGIRDDVRYALRSLRKNVSFTGVAVLSLALGIAVNVAMFADINAVMLRPFPYPELERVVTVRESVPKNGAVNEQVAPANFLDWRESARSFESLAAFRPWDASLTMGADPERVTACKVSPDYFKLLGIKPAIGRGFLASEAEPGHDGEAVVSQAFWRDRLGSVPNVLGKTVSLQGRTYAVVGVMPADFDFPLATDLWVPLALTTEERHERSSRNLGVLGRLKPGISTAQAQAELATVARQLEQRYPATNEGRSAAVRPLIEMSDQIGGRFVMTLSGAALFVVLLACANVGNLQLARAASRVKEISLRTALGASRLRIVRQLLVESTLTSLASGALGVVFGKAYLVYAKSTIPAQVYRWVPGLKNLDVDTRTLEFSLVLCLVVGAICAIPAVVQLLRNGGADVNETLKEGGRSSSGSDSRRSSGLRSFIVALEVALAMVLLVGAGLMTQTFQRIANQDLGYDPKNVLSMDVSLPAERYEKASKVSGFYEQVLQGFQSLPQAQSVGAISYMGQTGPLQLEGRPAPRAGEPRPVLRAVSGQYLETVKIPIREGRGISEQDGPDATGVVVLSEALARRYWPYADPIGRRVKLDGHSPVWLTVVGVAGDVRDWFSGRPIDSAYVSYKQTPALSMELVVRTAGNPMLAASAARAALRSVDRVQPAYNVKSLDDRVAEETSGVRSAAVMMGAYAAIALVLSVTGIYAVSSFFVAQRKHEMGVRMALGATARNILALSLSRSMRLALFGLAIGAPLALLLTYGMSKALYDIVAIDFLTVLEFAAMLAAAALLAGYLPARRASKLDAQHALRNE